MALLSSGLRAELTAEEGRRLSDARETTTLSRAELRAAFNAADQFIDDNASAFNLALPLAARTALTAKQKAHLFALVAAKRAGIL